MKKQAPKTEYTPAQTAAYALATTYKTYGGVLGNLRGAADAVAAYAEDPGLMIGDLALTVARTLVDTNDHEEQECLSEAITNAILDWFEAHAQGLPDESLEAEIVRSVDAKLMAAMPKLELV